MRSRRLALVGAVLLGMGLVLGTLSTVLAPSQSQWSPGGWGPSWGPGGVMGGPISMGPMMGPGMMWGYGASAAPARGSAWDLAMTLGWLAALAFLAALIVGVVLLVRWLTSANDDSVGTGGASALEILKRRYIAGEIDEDEYEEGVKRTLA